MLRLLPLTPAFACHFRLMPPLFDCAMMPDLFFRRCYFICFIFMPHVYFALRFISLFALLPLFAIAMLFRPPLFD